MMIFCHHFTHPQALTLSLSQLPNTTTSGLCPVGLLPSVLTLWYQDLPYLHCLSIFSNSMQRGLYWQPLGWIPFHSFLTLQHHMNGPLMAVALIFPDL